MILHVVEEKDTDIFSLPSEHFLTSAVEFTFYFINKSLKRERKENLTSRSIKDGWPALGEKFTRCKAPLSKQPYFHRQLRDYHLVKERKKWNLPTFELSVPEKGTLGVGVGVASGRSLLRLQRQGSVLFNLKKFTGRPRGLCLELYKPILSQGLLPFSSTPSHKKTDKTSKIQPIIFPNYFDHSNLQLWLLKDRERHLSPENQLLPFKFLLKKKKRQK